MKAVVLAWALVVACGDNEPGALDPSSGTRLALKVFTYEDGTVQLDRGAVRDSARGEDCAPERWTDGLRYCTPPAVEIVYVDGQCLTRAARAPVGSTASYAVARGVDQLVRTLYRLGAPYVGATSLTWRLEDGQCAGPYASDGDASYFQLGDEQPRDQLVRTTQQTTGTGRLQLVEETSDDGLVLPARYHDRQLVLDCDAAPRPHDAMTTCAPVEAVAASYFADAACTVPVAAVTTNAAPPAISSDASGCTRYYSVAAEVAAGGVRAPGSCTPTTAPAGARTFAAGGELALVTLGRTVTPGTRLRLVRLDGATTPLFDRFVYDTQLGTDCAPARLAGELRCMPAVANAMLAERYTDAGCTRPVDVAYVTADPCQPPAGYMVDSAGTWRQLGAPIATALYELDLGSCTLVADPPSNVAAVAAGPPLVAGAFAAVN